MLNYDFFYTEFIWVHARKVCPHFHSKSFNNAIRQKDTTERQQADPPHQGRTSEKKRPKKLTKT